MARAHPRHPTATAAQPAPIRVTTSAAGRPATDSPPPTTRAPTAPTIAGDAERSPSSRRRRGPNRRRIWSVYRRYCWARRRSRISVRRSASSDGAGVSSTGSSPARRRACEQLHRLDDDEERRRRTSTKLMIAVTSALPALALRQAGIVRVEGDGRTRRSCRRRATPIDGVDDVRSTNAATTAPSTPPMTTATARSTTLPRIQERLEVLEHLPSLSLPARVVHSRRRSSVEAPMRRSVCSTPGSSATAASHPGRTVAATVTGCSIVDPISAMRTRIGA